jgi:hypothetical protein
MHAREMAEVAALVAVNAQRVIACPAPVSTRGIEQYWRSAKCRLDRWARAFRSLAMRPEPDARRPAAWHVVAGLCEEVLIAEMLARAWAAVVVQHDRRHGQHDAEPVVHSVLLGQLEARHRVLALLSQPVSVAAEHASRLNALRRRCERYCDMLVGYVSGDDILDEFALDPVRAREYADSLAARAARPGGRPAATLLLASVRTAFRQSISPESPNADLNAAIAEAVLGCLDGDTCDSATILRSLWLRRLVQAADDASTMLAELL